jgi:hypothetical protein
MNVVRRFRPWFAALALLLSPGGLAPWLQLAHACPADRSAAHHDSMAGMGGMAMALATPVGHHDRSPGAPASPSHGPHPCACIGACHTLGPTELPRAVVLPAPVVAAAPPSRFAPPAAPDLLRPTALHPPATAPPVSA